LAAIADGDDFYQLDVLPNHRSIRIFRCSYHEEDLTIDLPMDLPMLHQPAKGATIVVVVLSLSILSVAVVDFLFPFCGFGFMRIVVIVGFLIVLQVY